MVIGEGREAVSHLDSIHDCSIKERHVQKLIESRMESGTVTTHNIEEEFEFYHILSFALAPTNVTFRNRWIIVPSLGKPEI